MNKDRLGSLTTLNLVEFSRIFEDFFLDNPNRDESGSSKILNDLKSVGILKDFRGFFRIYEDFRVYRERERKRPCLQSADRIDFGDVDDGSQGFQGLAAAFAHFTVSADDHLFAAEHHVRCPFQTVQKHHNNKNKTKNN